jgi:AraC-like DNA-binding protein
MSVNRAPGIGKGYSEVLIRYGNEQGLSTSQCIEGSGLSKDFLESQVDISCEQEIILIENLLKKINKPFATGFAIGKQFHFGSLGMLGMAMITSKNPKHMANIVSRYLDKAYHLVEPKLEIQSSKFKVTWNLRHEFYTELKQFLVARDIGIFGAIQEHYLQGTKKDVTELGFEFPYLAGMEDMANYFSCTVLNNQKSNYLIADQLQLNKTMPLYNPIASNNSEKCCQEHLKKYAPPENTLEKIKNRILSNLQYTPSMQETAEYFNISTRSMARLLEKNNTNWRSFVSRIRIEKAEQILQETERPLWDIAEELGFSSSSAFSHAFTKQKKISPSEFRKKSCEVA